MTHPTLALLPFTPTELETAYRWLCLQRRHYPDNADIWDFRFHWETNKAALLAEINRGDFQFSPVKRITKANGAVIHLWSSADALVMKLLAEWLTPKLNLSKHCTHVKGHGGLKQSVVRIQTQLSQYQYVCKTDVKQFYESIDQHLLMEQIHHQVKNKHVKRYLWQIIRRTVEYGGLYREISTGISRGCSLSPILGALYLSSLDKQFEKQGVFYLRYMDDILILTKTRWQNRKAVKRLNQCFNQLKVQQHPDKTYIGKIDKGFDFLGYHFSKEPLQLAHQTVKKHVEHLYRLYEQQIKTNATSSVVALVLGDYATRWQRWCVAGLGVITEIDSTLDTDLSD